MLTNNSLKQNYIKGNPIYELMKHVETRELKTNVNLKCKEVRLMSSNTITFLQSFISHKIITIPIQGSLFLSKQDLEAIAVGLIGIRLNQSHSRVSAKSIHY